MNRRRHLTLVTQENATRLKLYAEQSRKVKAEPKPTPTPPKTAA